MTTPGTPVDRFLASYPPAIQDLVWQARALVLASLRSLPQTDEVVDASARLLAYRQHAVHDSGDEMELQVTTSHAIFRHRATSRPADNGWHGPPR
jgi:hypothetical protein